MQLHGVFRQIYDFEKKTHQLSTVYKKWIQRNSFESKCYKFEHPYSIVVFF